MTSIVKYHTNGKGYITPCNARIRCQFSGSRHFTQKEYDLMKNNNDPLILSQKKDDETTQYFTQARKQYEEASNMERKNKSLNRELDIMNAHMDAKHNVSEADKYGISTYLNNLRNEIYDDIKKAYIKEGVNPTRAEYIVANLKRFNRFTPTVKKKDVYDENIQEKTQKAVTAIRNDDSINLKIKNYENPEDYKLKMKNWAEEKTRKTQQIKKKYTKRYPGYSFTPIQDNRLEALRNRYRNAGFLKNANVPDGYEIKKINALKADDISVGEKGEITNVWVRKSSGQVERVTTYVLNEDKNDGGSFQSDYLLTEGNKKIFHFTHYAGFRHTDTGTDKLIVGPKTGKTLEAPTFRIVSSIDSGD